ncbi:MAG: DUF488 domain-containing protein [Prevotella sp.]|nr:DUF488 domain-containing protein [Prevotella sp.]
MEMILVFNINTIIDVRSIPFSQHTPQFNMENLKFFLTNHGILYAHFGSEFGARRDDCLSENTLKDGSKVMQVNFELGIKTINFKNGINRIDNALSQNRTIALMCTESNPLDCHRFSFISRYLYDNGYEVSHIMKNKKSKEIYAKKHEELEEIMIKEFLSKKKPELKKTDKQLEYEGIIPGLIESISEEQQRKDAYRLKNRDIGFVPSLSYDESIY